MIKQIQLRGISRSPSDRMTSDGGCSESLNVITDNTELAPMPMPEDITSEFGLPKHFSAEVLYIHSYGGIYKNAIVYMAPNRLVGSYSSNGAWSKLFSLMQGEEVKSVSAIGNTLVFATSNRLIYVLYDGEYHYLGDGIPMPQINFLSSTAAESFDNSNLFFDFIINFDTWVKRGENGIYDAPTANSKAFLSGVRDEINSRMALRGRAGCIAEPTFVRFAVRLYDGTHTNISIPLLMGADMSPRFGITVGNTSDSRSYAQFQIKAKKILFSRGNDNTLLENWKDVISGIDVFMSIPRSYWPEADKALLKKSGRSYTLSLDPENIPNTEKILLSQCSDFRLVKHFDLDEFLKLTQGEYIDLGDKADFSSDALGVLPSLTDSDYRTLHRVTAEKLMFYNNRLILSNVSSLLPNPHPFLQGAAGETVDGSKADEFGYAFRFHIRSSNGQEMIRWAENPDGGRILPNLDANILGLYVQTDCQTMLCYPDSRCYQVDVIYSSDRTGSKYDKCASLPMKESESGDFSYAFWGFGGHLQNVLDKDYGGEWDDTNNSGAEHISNALYQSMTDNPFRFPPSGIFRFDSDVLAAAMATIALSSGQFGQFPLYVFTKGGIWSMETAADGSFVSKKPLSRDVALSADCITQIEQAVVFTTDKGVMLLSGSDIKNISPFMTGKHYVLENQSAGMLGKSGTWSPLLPAVSDATPFMDFMRSAKCAYDYTGQRLLFFNDGEAYQYVYKFDTDTWHKMSLDIPPFEDHQYIRLNIGAYNQDTVDLTGLFGWFESHGTTMVRPIEEWTTEKMQMGGTYLIGYNDNEDNYNYLYEYFNDGSPWDMQADLDGFNNTQKVSVLNSYPDCWVSLRVKDGGTKILNLSTAFDTDKVQPLKGIIVTRPFDLEEPDIRKAIRSIRIRGNFNRNDVKYILQASMDGIHWGVLPSLRAGSFKLFRLVLLCDLEAYERISYIDIDYETRFTNRLR